ncbi:hypothetical protein [Lysobacter olei]
MKLNVAWAALALAVAAVTIAPVHAAPAECTPAADCTVYRNRVTFPANALPYGPASAFALNIQGLDWVGLGGSLSLTVRRPLDFKGNKVRLTVVYQATSGNDGTNAFGVTAIGFRHGNAFETYGGTLSNVLDIPPNGDQLWEQSVVLQPGEGWDPAAPWWHFQIGRQGTYDDNLRVMAVTLEY